MASQSPPDRTDDKARNLFRAWFRIANAEDRLLDQARKGAKDAADTLPSRDPGADVRDRGNPASAVVTGA